MKARNNQIFMIWDFSEASATSFSNSRKACLFPVDERLASEFGKSKGHLKLSAFFSKEILPVPSISFQS